MNTIDLIGAELEYWTMQAERTSRDACRTSAGGLFLWSVSGSLNGSPTRIPNYSVDWSSAGPIIERERIALTWREDHWSASVQGTTTGPCVTVEVVGPTPLVAAMRAYVLSRLGTTVSDGLAPCISSAGNYRVKLATAADEEAMKDLRNARSGHSTLPPSARPLEDASLLGRDQSRPDERLETR
jgi:hypothetical protein